VVVRRVVVARLGRKILFAVSAAFESDDRPARLGLSEGLSTAVSSDAVLARVARVVDVAGLFLAGVVTAFVLI
jgi:hypothetical protein